jgi:outer membrane protein assembly factor BamB
MRIQRWVAIAIIAGAIDWMAVAQGNDTNFFPVLSIRGENLTNATISSVHAAYVTILFDGGGKRVPLCDLPDFLQKRYGYDSAKAEQFDLEERRKTTESFSEQQSLWVAREKAQRASDWPQWRGPNRNGSGTSAEVLANSWPPEGPRKIWVAHGLPLGGAGSPVVANGRVYAYIHQRNAKLDTVVCLDERTGAKEWQRDFPVAMVTLHEASGTPCISGARCVVMGARFCYCLDATTGVPIWERDTHLPSKDPGLTGPRQEDCSSFAIVNDVAVVLCGPPQGYDLQTGKLLWQAEEGGGWSGANSSVSICPGDRIVYTGQWQLSCVEAKTGKIVWKLPGGGKHLTTYGVTPVVSGNILLATSDDELRGFDLSADSPHELWHAPYGDEFSTPAASFDRCYMLETGWNARSNYTAWASNYIKWQQPYSLRGGYQIVCRNLKTGEIVWHTPIPDSQYASPILVNGKIFILSDNSREIEMLDAQDGRLLGSTVVGAVQHSTPAIAHGRMFLRVHQGIACYDLTAPGLEAARSKTPP